MLAWLELLAALGGPKAAPATIGSSASSAILEQVDMFQHFEHVLTKRGRFSAASRRPNVIFTALLALGAQPKNCLCERGLPTDIEAGGRARVELCAAG